MATVLVLEKDAYLGELYEEELAGEGHTVWLATSVRDLRELVCKRHPDVAVLDLQTSGSDGQDTLACLMDIDPALSVILYSATSCYVVVGGAFRHVEYTHRKPLGRVRAEMNVKEVKSILEISNRVAIPSRVARRALESHEAIGTGGDWEDDDQVFDALTPRELF